MTPLWADPKVFRAERMSTARGRLEQHARDQLESLPPEYQEKVALRVLGKPVFFWCNLTRDEVIRIGTTAHLCAMVLELAP